MENDLQLLRDFKAAMLELTQRGTVSTSLIETAERTFTRVSIIIDNVRHHEDHEDVIIATIRLINQI
jgi:hypothetical protein